MTGEGENGCTVELKCKMWGCVFIGEDGLCIGPGCSCYCAYKPAMIDALICELKRLTEKNVVLK